MISAYEFQSEIITSKLKKVIVYSYVVSSVNMEDIELNDICALIDLQHDDLSEKQKEDLLKKAACRCFKEKDDKEKDEKEKQLKPKL